ncbi:MAG: DUF4339 domain-containing protein [bacterium]|nr:DUF4339 domain-containing protein [bacterium]
MIAYLPKFDDDVGPMLIAFLVVAAIYGVFGIICAVIAPSRGRSALGWFFIGVALQCIGIILLLLLPDLKVEAAKQRRREEESRKLRELLKKERQVSDNRHAAHRNRLGAHDRALGLDTSTAEEQALLGDSGAGGGSPRALPPAPPLPADAAASAEPVWHYAEAGQQRGPVPASKLRLLWREGRVSDDTLVWRQGLSDWTAIADLPEFNGGSDLGDRPIED